MLFGFIPESFSEQDIKSVMIFVDPPKNDKVTIQENQNEEDEKRPRYPGAPSYQYRCIIIKRRGRS